MKNFQNLASFFTWASTAFLFIVSQTEDRHAENKIRACITNVVACQFYFVEAVIMKLEKHRLSTIPIIINLALRNFMVHVVFGILDCKIHYALVSFCWLVIDTLKALHLLIKSDTLGFIRYHLTLVVFLVQAAYECTCIYRMTIEFRLLSKWFMRLFLVAHAIGLSIILKHRMMQLYWFNKNRCFRKHKIE